MTRATGVRAVHLLAIAGLTAFAACGGGGNGGSPTGPNTGGGSPGASGATITIANGRVTPSEVTVSAGQSVTFVNNNGRSHDVSSDPHPTHTECPQINAVGLLQNNQTRLTNAFPASRSCGFHDHNDPDNASLRGRINIQ